MLSFAGMENPKSGEWEQHWGRDYDPTSKAEYLAPLFKGLEMQGKIGDVVVDIGSGQYSVAKLIPGKHRILSLDIAGREVLSPQRAHINANIDRVAQEDSFSYKKALLKAARFLEIDAHEEKNPEQADTMIFSEILNYVDYKAVLQAFSKFLKVGGRIIVNNMPGRGFPSLFSEDGVTSNSELITFLEDQGFELEQVKYPWRMDQESAQTANTMMTVVARKLKDESSK